jgi:superfamily II DNA or RNA helicase
MRFLRSKHERNHIYILANGKCCICGIALESGWHADHIIPYNICKKTELSNMQAICETCNLKKGCKMLRKHQQELKTILEKIVENYKKTGILSTRFLAEDIYPGGGKSAHPIIAFEILRNAGIVDKLCWLVPRSSLKLQGAQEFLKPYLKSIFPHNLTIRETEFSADQDPCRGTDGFITTYNAIATGSHICRSKGYNDINLYEFSKHKYLLFLDEFHHLTSSKNTEDSKAYDFYKAVKPLYDLAEFRIGVSGTMERNNNEEIAFVDYFLSNDEQGNSIYKPRVDIEYSWKDALDDKSVIELTYHPLGSKCVSYYKGKMPVNKEKIENSTDLCVALETGYGNVLLKAGINHWQSYRSSKDHRAKVIIIGKDQQHCRDIVKQLSSLIPMDSVALAINDEKDAHNNIKKFRLNPDYTVLVTCQMAHEGLDCKQATHLICLTLIRSKPWLKQAFTRVTRYDEKGLTYDKQQAFAFVPNDKPLIDILKKINAKNGGIIPYDEKNNINDLLNNIKSNCETSYKYVPPLITKKHSEASEFSQMTDFGEDLDSITLAKIRMHQQIHNIKGDELSVFRTLKSISSLHVLDQYTTMSENYQKSADAEILPKTTREREQDLRREIEKLTRKADSSFGYEKGTWNKKMFNINRRRKRKDMTEADLKILLETLEKEIIKEAAKVKTPI